LLLLQPLDALDERLEVILGETVSGGFVRDGGCGGHRALLSMRFPITFRSGDLSGQAARAVIHSSAHEFRRGPRWCLTVPRGHCGTACGPGPESTAATVSMMLCRRNAARLVAMDSGLLAMLGPGMTKPGLQC